MPVPKPAHPPASQARPHERGVRGWYLARSQAASRAPRQCVTYNSTSFLWRRATRPCNSGLSTSPAQAGEQRRLTDGQIADVARHPAFSFEDVHLRWLGLAALVI